MHAVRYGAQPDSGFGTALYSPKLSGSQDPFDWFIKDAGERVRLNTTTNDASGQSWETTENWPVGQWQTAAFTWRSGSHPDLYRGGRKLSRSFTSDTAPSGVLKPGGVLSINLGALRLNGAVAAAIICSKTLSDDQIAQYAQDFQSLLQLLAPQSIWVPVSAGGATTHATTGALAGAGGTVDGTAAHIAIHGTSGVLAGSGATVDGASARTRAHPTSGVLAGSGGVVDGTARHNVPHPTTGVLAGAGGEVVGAADHTVPGGTHDTSGALAGGGGVIAGTAAHVAIHGTSGVLAGSGGAVVGTAARVAAAVTHDTSGALVGGGAVIEGRAATPQDTDNSGGWPIYRRKKKKDDDEELEPAVIEAVAVVPAPRRMVTLEKLIGKKAAAQVNEAQLSSAIRMLKRKRQDEELMLM